MPIAISTSRTVPFQGNAAGQWLPAIENARAHAQQLGYQDFGYEGSGILARGGPNVNAIEVQKLYLVDANGARHEVGQTIPEQGHLQALKSTAALTEEFQQMIDTFHDVSAPDTVPFQGNAAAQWLPAIESASAYAQTLGFQDVGYEATGIRVRGMGPQVNAIEVQRLTLTDGAGNQHTLGEILPERDHMRTLKSTKALVKEMKALIDQFAVGTVGSTGHSLAGPQTRRDAPPSVGRPRG